MKKLFALFFCSIGLVTMSFAQQKKIVADKIIGIVGDRIILQSDIKNAIADAARQGQQVPAGAECSVLDQALTSKLLMLQAERDSLPVTDEEVEAELDQRVRYFIKQYGDQATLEQVAGKTIYQIKDDARASVKEHKLAEAMQRKIIEGVRITPTEVQNYFNRIPKDSLPFFETELSIGQIVVYPKVNRDLEKYVQDELNNYRNQILSKQTTFEQLAKRYSEGEDEQIRGRQFQINRNDKQWDPAFMAAAFRLKEGEISQPVKTQFGYHIIQMLQRNGDDAIVRHILRIPPVTAVEIAEASSKLDSVRAKLIAGIIDFNTAAGKYTEDKNASFAGPYILSRNGSTFVAIDELDKDVVSMLNQLKVGEYSQPVAFTDERGKKGVRILYLKSRSNPHRMNLRDDYDRIAQAALEEKKYQALEKWMGSHINTYYVMVDPELTGCPVLNKWTEGQKQTAQKGF